MFQVSVLTLPLLLDLTQPILVGQDLFEPHWGGLVLAVRAVEAEGRSPALQCHS